MTRIAKILAAAERIIADPNAPPDCWKAAIEIKVQAICLGASERDSERRIRVRGDVTEAVETIDRSFPKLKGTGT